MALLKIARMGHPVLSAPSEAVEDPASPAIAQLVEDMIETMHDAQGTGLAAPQVHVPLRLVIYTVYPERARAEDGAEDGDEGEEGTGGGVPLTVLINPEIEPLTEDKVTGWEGCLSIPGMMGEVPRYAHIRVKHLDLNGESREFEARGFHARVVQHECDHLDGILYPYRVEDMSRFGFTEELVKQAHDDQAAED